MMNHNWTRKADNSSYCYYNIVIRLVVFQYTLIITECIFTVYMRQFNCFTLQTEELKSYYKTYHRVE